ncbi:MAG: efflux transporter outer membrane subunit, partial [Betaproteobacteria bacterium]
MRSQPRQTEAAPVRGGEAQRFEVGAEISAEWWTLFGSPELDELMRTALSGHPTLAAAQAALRQAEENLNAQYSVLYPSVDAGLSARRQRISGASFGNPAIPGSVFNLYNASVNVSYAIDVAGGARRELEALQAGIDFQRFQLEATYLSLTANIATTAFREASLREQIRATRDIVDSQERQAQLVEKQFDLGALSRADVLAQRAQLAQTRANLPPLEKALAQTRNQLAVLVGKFPDEARLPELDLSAFQLPQNLPLSLPSDLVRQRPDIRAAETVLRQTNARIGVAQALMFPQLTLSGSYGSAATSASNLFDPGTQIWNIGASLLQPIFHAGQLRARKRGAEAAYDQAFAQYQQTVLGAFQN